MPYYGQNGFYLPFKNNASTTTLGWDYSDVAVRYNATVLGNAQISTAQSKFGGSSALFDGTGDYLTLINKEYLGASDFTVELWARPVANSYVNIVNINGNSTNYAALRLSFINDVTNPVLGLAMSNNGTAWQVNATISTSHTLNTWAHYAICKSGSTVKVYKDGTEISSHAITGTLMTGDRTWIGAVAAGQNYNGYIDDLRVYRGICKYTANFTAPTAALPLGNADSNWNYVEFAMPMDGTNASTAFPIYAPNNWTPNNFSVTAGAGNDSLIDVPTRYGDGNNNRGNYCTFDPLSSQGNTTSDGNLQATLSATIASVYGVRGTLIINPGTKYYWEITPTVTTSVFTVIGIIDASYKFGGDVGVVGSKCVMYYKSSGTKIVDGTTTAYSTTYVANDVIGVAVDYVSNTITFYKNGISQGAIGLPSTTINYVPAVGNENGFADVFVANFGQRPFSYTPPTGFKALNTFNLP